MNNDSLDSQIRRFKTIDECLQTPFSGIVNAHVFERTLDGDFEEIIVSVNSTDKMVELDIDLLSKLRLSEAGERAKAQLIEDYRYLQNMGASPTLNLIKCYDRDEVFPFFPTDVYSFHVDASPVPNDTILCTYFGAPSEIIANADAEQKVLIPEIRAELKKLYHGADSGFEAFLKEHYFDLHYQAKPGANIMSLGLGNIWRLAGDYPGNLTLPSVHRAPVETGYRLMIIC
ncbi:MAG: hypothetical protein MH472_01955 [Bacteroidia bacterium]|nr:hypothetical protein [Bacteroidia bacterium]